MPFKYPIQHFSRAFQKSTPLSFFSLPLIFVSSHCDWYDFSYNTWHGDVI